MNKKITIEFYSILKDLIRNAWVVVLSVLIGFMGVYIASEQMYTPEYTSSATVVVNQKSVFAENFSSFGMASEMAEIISQVLVEPTVKTKAAEYAEKSYFNGKLTASNVAETNFIDIRVTSSSPQTSYELLTAVLAVYPQVSDKVFANAVITPITLPTMPHGPSNNPVLENKNLVMSACAVFAIAIIIVLSIVRDTVKNEQVFEEKIDAKLLGVIPHERKFMNIKDVYEKKKKSLLINGNNLVGLRFSEGYHKTAAKIEFIKRRTGHKIFAVTSVAENEGKSTTASNLALSLANSGKSVILFDLDRKKPALYKIFQEEYKENYELGELFNGKTPYSKFCLRTYKKTSMFLGLNTYVHQDYDKWIKNGEVAKVIEYCQKKVDYIIIDTAPLSADSMVTDIVKLVDETIMVVRADRVPVAAVNDAISTIEEVGGTVAGCILNDAYPSVSIFGMTGVDEGGYYYGKKYGKNKYYNNYYAYNSREVANDRLVQDLGFNPDLQEND
ncbi:MAG: P-loop NTPase [Clostridia bacterium]|nr:P-loop NTPase [Clostridia bacterium]MBR6531035.1 P-loop NTPase [Clostridia bacterium]